MHDDYRQIKALNWSSLKDVNDSPLHYKWRQDHPRKATPALDLGTAVHLAVLEPDRYEAECVRRPDEWDSWRTKASKEWREEQVKAGRIILDDDMADTIRACADAVDSHLDASELLEGARHEETIRWEIEGVACKARADAIASDRIVDLKTTRSLETRAWGTAAARYLYHGQMAWYLDGAIAAGACSPDASAYIVAVETEGPYDVAAMRLGRDTIDAGRALYRRLLYTWMGCREMDFWPGRNPNLVMWDVPPWADGMDGEEGI